MSTTVETETTLVSIWFEDGGCHETTDDVDSAHRLAAGRWHARVFGRAG
jgi:hypothetical protein